MLACTHFRPGMPPSAAATAGKALLPGRSQWRAKVAATVFVALASMSASSWAQPIATLTKITNGTIIGEEPIPGWSDRILIARPRVASGDVDAVSEIVKKHAELLSFVLLARVERSADAASPSATLEEVGIGLATAIDGRLQVVSGPPAAESRSDTQSPQAELGFIGNRVLRSAERSLDEMRVVVRRTTLLIYDSPAVIKLNGGNQISVVRSMIWLEPQSGKLHHAIWAMQKGGQVPWVPALEHGVYLPVPFEEDRILHVDTKRFSFGIPAATAFALASLPPGYPFSLAGGLGESACRESYDESQLRELASGLISALRRENP